MCLDFVQELSTASKKSVVPNLSQPPNQKKNSNSQKTQSMLKYSRNIMSETINKITYFYSMETFF